MTTAEIRIDGTKKKIDKLNTKIERLHSKIKATTARIEANMFENEHEKYWVGCDLKDYVEDLSRATKTLAEEKDKLEHYRSKRDAEKKAEAEMPNIKAVEDFLTAWRKSAFEFYQDELKAFREMKAALKDLKYSESKKKLSERFSASIFNYDQYSSAGFIEQLNKDLNNEVKCKRIELYRRCSAIVGVIGEATRLECGINGSINGVVVGDIGKARIETIFAGGHNIQVLHYRVLVKKIK